MGPFQGELKAFSDHAPQQAPAFLLSGGAKGEGDLRRCHQLPSGIRGNAFILDQLQKANDFILVDLACVHDPDVTFWPPGLQGFLPQTEDLAVLKLVTCERDLLVIDGLELRILKCQERVFDRVVVCALGLPHACRLRLS